MTFRFTKTSFVRRLALAAVLAIAACESPVAPVSCATPESVLTAPDHTVERTFCFTDANMDDVLSYAVNVLNPGIARAMVSGTDRVAVTGLEEGTTTVEIVATDPGGLAATVSLPVEVVAPMSGNVTSCRGARVGSLVQATVEGTVTANLRLRDVSIGAYIDGDLVGRQFVGDMRRGETEDISITGLISPPSPNATCGLGGSWSIAAASQAEVPLRLAPAALELDVTPRDGR